MAKDTFYRYIWLIDTIYQHQPITFKEIQRRWRNNAHSNGESMPRRTFCNHLNSIQEMFDINIECVRKGGNNLYGYRIDENSITEGSTLRKWLMNTFTVNNLIDDNVNLRPRILFEEIPSGQKYLEPIIEAMRDNHVIEITYFSLGQNEESTFEVEPLCVKVFKQRWYLVAQNALSDPKRIRIYGLDRIQNLTATEKDFRYPKDFDPKRVFENSYGIMVDKKIPIEKVRVKGSADQRPYFRWLPLHASQKEEVTNADFSIFTYELQITYDFCQELLSHGYDVEVIEPNSLRNNMKEIFQEALKHYE